MGQEGVEQAQEEQDGEVGCLEALFHLKMKEKDLINVIACKCFVIGL